MATVLDVGLIKGLDSLWPFLLVFVLAYAVLSKSVPYFKENQFFSAVIAFLLAILGLFSPVVTKTLTTSAPWFILLMIFFFFVLVAFQTLGVKGDSITSIVTSEEYGGIISMWVLALILIIVLGSLSAVISEQTPGGFIGLRNESIQETGSATEGFWGVLFHPKVLGLAFLLLISLYTIKYMTERER